MVRSHVKLKSVTLTVLFLLFAVKAELDDFEKLQQAAAAAEADTAAEGDARVSG